jgi:hypothetical protein
MTSMLVSLVRMSSVMERKKSSLLDEAECDDGVFPIVLTHSVTQLLTHSLTNKNGRRCLESHSLGHCFSHSVTQSLSHSVTQSLCHSVTAALLYSLGIVDRQSVDY